MYKGGTIHTPKFIKAFLFANLFISIILIIIEIYFQLNFDIQTNSANILIFYIILLICIVLSIISAAALIFPKPQKTLKIKSHHNKSQETLQHDRTLTIINNMTDAVLSTDMNGIIRIYNAASLNLIDTNDSLNGKSIDKVLPLTDQDGNPVSIFGEFQKAKTTVKRDDVNFTFEDGEKIRLEITFSPIRSSYSRQKNAAKRDGYVIIMRDVTKPKSLEEERDEFISVISHELRTPITIVEGNISNVQMMMDHPDISQDTLKQAIATAHDQVIFLANMVNDLSALSRAERGVGDSVETIDVTELAHKMMDKYTPDASAKGLQLNLDLAPSVGSVLTSRLYLEELLQDFITNSIKYTKQGSITIQFSTVDGQVKFAVSDTGIGISKTDQIKVFNKFYRSEDYRTRETGGTGLGLYVAAKLANKLGTKIELTSRLNHGSTFSFTLPIAKNQAK